MRPVVIVVDAVVTRHNRTGDRIGRRGQHADEIATRAEILETVVTSRIRRGGLDQNIVTTAHESIHSGIERHLHILQTGFSSIAQTVAVDVVEDHVPNHPARIETEVHSALRVCIGVAVGDRLRTRLQVDHGAEVGRAVATGLSAIVVIVDLIVGRHWCATAVGET